MVNLKLAHVLNLELGLLAGLNLELYLFKHKHLTIVTWDMQKGVFTEIPFI